MYHCSCNNVRVFEFADFFEMRLISSVILLALSCCLARPTPAQDVADPADPLSLTREQWNARTDAAKARIEEMRRNGRSMIAPRDENQEDIDRSNRILEDDTLVYGDIVATKQGLFRFIGKPDIPRKPEHFQLLK
jgi:hypothetical protein